MTIARMVYQVNQLPMSDQNKRASFISKSLKYDSTNQNQTGYKICNLETYIEIYISGPFNKKFWFNKFEVGPWNLISFSQFWGTGKCLSH